MNKNRTNNPNISSDRINTLANDEIFVFGSNLEGHHDGGAANAAFHKFGAIWGLGVGIAGQSYAIPTMHGGINDIKPYVDQFIDYLKSATIIQYTIKGRFMSR